MARGGQVLLSDTTRAIVAGDLPEDVELRSLGEQRLKDIDRPEPLHELRIPDVPTSPEATSSPVGPAPPAVSAPPAAMSPRDLLPPLDAAARKDMSGWARSVKERAQSFGDLTRRTIEERVLAELDESFREPDADGPPRDRQRSKRGHHGPTESPPAAAPGSVAAEIAQLQALRDSGALTDEQYAKAVDRAIQGRD